jgi:hypothetical protein
LKEEEKRRQIQFLLSFFIHSSFDHDVTTISASFERLFFCIIINIIIGMCASCCQVCFFLQRHNEVRKVNCPACDHKKKLATNFNKLNSLRLIRVIVKTTKKIKNAIFISYKIEREIERQKYILIEFIELKSSKFLARLFKARLFSFSNYKSKEFQSRESLTETHLRNLCIFCVLKQTFPLNID